MTLSNDEQNKFDPTENIKKHKVGNEDSVGDKILGIISKRDQYVIYEIESKSVQNRIRILIDSCDEELAKKIIKKFNHVKSEYIKAKAALLHTDNYEENKNLIAHTLSSYLDDYENINEDDRGEAFKEIVNDIFKKNKMMLINSMSMIAPFLLFLIIPFIVKYWCSLSFSYNSVTLTSMEYFCLISFGTSLGSLMSLFMSLKKRNLQEFDKWYLYSLLGLQKLMLGLVSSTIFLLILNSEIITIKFFENSIIGVLMVCILAGFSERLIPTLLSNSESSISRSI
ncbi:hypothetical protein [Aggregatibacter sp. Marseille-P9115]|jgi:hypothetical protein|uniref:hypothetical protein n=1 Tax=Aggregatibacter sp. Marseille-P9115 TaxID=2866570 RepID=UPI001E4E3B87|nr:hypothetical protein [Aggregatibacter sp. Marseille-P9115]